MNFAINPINANAINTSAQFNLYKQGQQSAQKVSKIVFQSLTMLSNSGESGISLESLESLKKLFEDKGVTKSSAYELVNTMIDKFSALSSDGKTITESDFLSTIKFSVAQDYRANTGIYNALRPNGYDFSKDILALFGQTNLETLDLMRLMDSLSDETLGKIIANLKAKEEGGASLAPKTETPQTNKYASVPQEYTSVTSEQLKSPISIAV